MNELRPFHLAFLVTDIEKTKEFYTNIFKCNMGREDKRWVDFDLYGHQITAHLVDSMPFIPTNSVDNHNVPASHFGVILKMSDFKKLETNLKKYKIKFLINPYLRFKGKIGEQYTMFLTDPSGNALEFKAFTSDHIIFEKK